MAQLNGNQEFSAHFGVVSDGWQEPKLNGLKLLAALTPLPFGHLDVRVTKYLGQLVQITVVHHVPGRERMTQIVKAEAPDFCPYEQVLEAAFQSLPTADRTLLWRENSAPADAEMMTFTHSGMPGGG